DAGRLLSLSGSDDRAIGKLRRVKAEAHRAAHVPLTSDDVDLVGHCRDDRMGARRVELSGVGAFQPGERPGDLDHHALQAEAKAESRNAVLPRILDRPDFSLDPAHAEAAGYHDPIHASE